MWIIKVDLEFDASANMQVPVSARITRAVAYLHGLPGNEGATFRRQSDTRFALASAWTEQGMADASLSSDGVNERLAEILGPLVSIPVVTAGSA